MRRQSGMVQLYVIGGMLAALIVAGLLLKASYKANGQLQADVANLNSAVVAKDKAFEDLKSEKARVEVITIDNLAEKEIVEVKVEKVVYKIQEVIKNAPPESCLNQPIDPAVLDCMLTLSCDETGSAEGETTSVLDGRLSVARSEAQNLR